MKLAKHDNIKIYVGILVLFYIMLSLGSLSFFPFAHSDEGWLASLSRSVLTERNPAATEDFFHRTVRYPHAVKIIFHLSQIPFVAASFSLLSVRILSFTAGMVCLLFIFITSENITGSRLAAGGVTALVAVDTEFLYISHLARQDIMTAAVLAISLYLFFKPRGIWGYRKDFLIGITVGISGGIHPNIFIVASGILALYLFQAVLRFITGKQEYPSIKNISLFLAIMVFWVLFYGGISMLMNPDFISSYLDFGASHGVTMPLWVKILRLPRFYIKIYRRLSGTYYLPDIRPQLILFAASFISGIPAALLTKRYRTELLSLNFLVLGINAGIIIIGKYSPPSIVLVFIPGYISAAVLLNTVIKSRKLLFSIFSMMAAASLVFSIIQIYPWEKYSYNKFIGVIKENIPEEAKVFGNLNTVFAFQPGNLFAYRDLEGVDEDFSFESYISNNGISYIIYSSELETVYRERPVWNTMYGNIYPWYEQMMQFINQNCILTDTWSEPVYGMRITSYLNKRPGTVNIYKVSNTILSR